MSSLILLLFFVSCKNTPKIVLHINNEEMSFYVPYAAVPCKTNNYKSYKGNEGLMALMLHSDEKPINNEKSIYTAYQLLINFENNKEYTDEQLQRNIFSFGERYSVRIKSFLQEEMKGTMKLSFLDENNLFLSFNLSVSGKIKGAGIKPTPTSYKISGKGKINYKDIPKKECIHIYKNEVLKYQNY